MKTRITVHPRVCGEHVCCMVIGSCPIGSSPRVRGTLPLPLIDTFIIRFIPACAGNTKASFAIGTHYPVHPRVCGEHTGADVMGFFNCGSSPRVRGTPISQKKAGQRCRFIPACAGNTLRPASDKGGSPVHPRVCGEHVLANTGAFQLPGSSPRVRGTLLVSVSVSVWARFIPACAGNTPAVTTCH